MSPRIVDKEAKRAEITTAAIEVFARKGFQGAAVDDIAVAAGVSKGTLYGYFENKEDLFYASFRAFEGEVVKDFQDATDAPISTGEKLTASFSSIAETLHQHIELFPLTLEVWAAASSGPGRERFAGVMEGLYREFRGLTAELIEGGKAAGEIRPDVDAVVVAAWLVGGLDGLILQHWFDRSIEVQRATAGFLEIVLRGIRTETEERP